MCIEISSNHADDVPDLVVDVHDLIVFVKKRRVVFVSPFCIGLLASAAAGALLEKLKNT